MRMMRWAMGTRVIDVVEGLCEALHWKAFLLGYEILKQDVKWVGIVNKTCLETTWLY